MPVRHAVAKFSSSDILDADGTYGAGANLTLALNFSGAVTVTGVPQLALNSGGVANYSSGSDTNQLKFTYTVAAGQSSAKLDYSSTTALTGTIMDNTQSPPEAADLTLPAPGATGSLSATSNVVIAA